MTRKSDRLRDAEDTLLDNDLERISDEAYVLRIHHNSITYVLDYQEEIHLRLSGLGHKAEKSDVAMRWEIPTLDQDTLEIVMT
jgi:hypothetical protein